MGSKVQAFPVILSLVLSLFLALPAQALDIHLLVVDSLRADHLETYGYERKTAPNLALLSKLSIVYRNASSAAPWTPSSVASILTGVYPTIHGVRTISGDRSTLFETIRGEIPTLAERLKKYGYRTAAVTTNSWLTETRGYARGFDLYENPHNASASEVNKRALEIVAQDKDTPLFMYLHYMDVHGPYNVRHHKRNDVHEGEMGTLPQRYRRKLPKDAGAHAGTGWGGSTNLAEIVHAYDVGIRGWDRDFGEYIQKIDWRNTVLIITSDHGEEFFEHKRWYHGHSVYEELLHVPLVVYIPHGPKEGVLYSVSTTQILSTILEIAANEPHAGSLLGIDHDVASFAEIWMDESRLDLSKQSLRLGFGKALRIKDRVMEYDLRKDPNEQYPLPQAALSEILDKHISRMIGNVKHMKEVSKTNLEDSTIERLEALGYLQ